MHMEFKMQLCDMIKTLVIAFVSMLSVCGYSQQITSRYCSKYKLSTTENRLTIQDHRSDSVDLIHTSIYLDMTNVGSSQIAGYSKIDLVSRVGNNGYVRFDFEGLEVDSIAGSNVASFYADDSTVLVSFNSPLNLGEQTQVRIYYHGSPIKDASGWGGFYFSAPFAWNLGVGFASDPHSYGRVWFPCFDNFIERTTFDFHIKVNNDRTASCNGLLDSISSNGDGTSTHHWSLAQSIPSYLACVAVGPYSPVNGTIAAANGVLPYQIFGRPIDSANIVASFIHLSDAVLKFEEAYGPYRFDKVGYSLVPFNSGAMEHATNIAYPISAANGGLGQEGLMAHELAHMWWGDNVTCQTDGDMWINEGWASFSVYLFMEAVYGRKEYESTMLDDLRYMLQFGHVKEGGYRAVSGQPHEYVYGDHVYKKGALVAHNLRGYMGDELFFGAIDQLMEQFKYSPISSDTVEKYFAQYSGLDLGDFFRDWIFRPGYNVVLVDSFQSTEGQDGFDVKLFLQQKLKGTDQFHDGLPVFYSVYDKNWNQEDGQTTMSGQREAKSLKTSLNPVLIVLYEQNQQAQARTFDEIVISKTGLVATKNFFWNKLNITSVEDSALLLLEHIWAGPDGIKDFDNQPFRLSNYHYWRVSGLNLSNLTMTGEVFFDGREAGNGGHLDGDLVSVQEDSLVLLFRESAASDWGEYGFYSKDVLGSNINAFGLVKLSEVMPGEYAFANIDHRVLAVSDLNQNSEMSLYPNPASSELVIELNSSGLDTSILVEVLDISGKLCLSEQIQSGKSTISIVTLRSGNYVCRVKSKSGFITQKFVVER
jgi:hypothetical protein